jgi:hypothetical protein
MNIRHLVACLVFASSIQLPVRAQAPATTQPAPKADENPYLWKPRTTSVAVFKNGYGFFMGDADVSLRDGWCTAAEIPPATFGTLAVYSHAPDQTVDVVGAGPGEVVEFDGRDAPADLKSKLARLETSKNLKVALTYTLGAADRTAAGKLVSVGPEYVVLEGDGNSFAVPAASIKKMQMLDLPLRVHVTTDAQKAPERAKVGLAYLRQGVTWIPAYTLRVLDSETAELTLRGTLVNEAEDIIHADVHFVVGVPHFLHTNYMEPIAVGRVIRTIGAAVAPPEVQSQIMSRAAIASNSIRQNQFGGGFGGEGQGGVVERAAGQPAGDALAAAGNLPVMESPGGSDFTVYTKKDLTVRRGERAIVTLFVKKVRYSHLYRWSPPGAPEHFLLLQNDNLTALTTGPCLAMSKDQPLSEDLLKYTPKGGKAEVPVTSAVNVATEQNESEVDRRLKAHSPSKEVFLDLVTLKGELKVRNFEPGMVEIIISVRVPGRPLAASDDGVTSIDPTKLSLREREGMARWRLKLKPGESKTLTYQYERYVPSN